MGRWQHLNQRYIDKGVCVDKVEYCIISIYLFCLVSPCFDGLSTCQSWAISRHCLFDPFRSMKSSGSDITIGGHRHLNVDAIEERLVELHCFVNALHAAQNPMMKNDHEALFPIMKTISSASLTNYTSFFVSLFMFFIFPWVKCAFAIPISHHGTFTNPSLVAFLWSESLPPLG